MGESEGIWGARGGGCRLHVFPALTRFLTHFSPCWWRDGGLVEGWWRAGDVGDFSSHKFGPPSRSLEVPRGPARLSPYVMMVLLVLLVRRRGGEGRRTSRIEMTLLLPPHPYPPCGQTHHPAKASLSLARPNTVSGVNMSNSSQICEKGHGGNCLIQRPPSHGGSEDSSGSRS